MGLGVQPWASGREAVGVARGPSHSRARAGGRRLKTAAGRRSDCSIVVVVVRGCLVLAVVDSGGGGGRREKINTDGESRTGWVERHFSAYEVRSFHHEARKVVLPSLIAGWSARVQSRLLSKSTESKSGNLPRGLG